MGKTARSAPTTEHKIVKVARMTSQLVSSYLWLAAGEVLLPDNMCQSKFLRLLTVGKMLPVVLLA